MKGLYIERHNEAVACVSKALMEGQKGGCLTALMIDAGWHGKVTGVATFQRIPQQVLPSTPDAVLKRMRPDLLLFERPEVLEGAGPLNLDSLVHASERQMCKVHVVEVGFCMETAHMTYLTAMKSYQRPLSSRSHDDNCQNHEYIVLETGTERVV